MTRALLAAILLLLVSATGCLGGEEEPGQEPPETPEDENDSDQEDQEGSETDDRSDDAGPDEERDDPPPPFLLQGEACQEARLRVPVDAEAARGLTPEGFTLEPYGQAGPVALPVDQAALRVLTLRCPTGGISAGGQGWTMHLLALHVQPPEELRAQQALSELYLIEAAVDRDSLAQAFGARGWAVSQGEVNLSLTNPPAGGTVFESQGAGGNLSTQFQGSTDGQNETRTSGFARYWHDPVERLEYLQVALTSFHEKVNATGLVQAQEPMSRTGELVGPGTSGPGALVGPYTLLATPTVIHAAR